MNGATGAEPEAADLEHELPLSAENRRPYRAELSNSELGAEASDDCQYERIVERRGTVHCPTSKALQGELAFDAYRSSASRPAEAFTVGLTSF
jgi:hypothetical protein